MIWRSSRLPRRFVVATRVGLLFQAGLHHKPRGASTGTIKTEFQMVVSGSV